MRRLISILIFTLAVAAGCGDDDGGDCSGSACGRCAPGCFNIDRCVGGEWQCDCRCPADATVDAPATDAPATDAPGTDGPCIAGGNFGCGADTPCCSPYMCSGGGYCCGGAPPLPHWDCR